MEYEDLKKYIYNLVIDLTQKNKIEIESTTDMFNNLSNYVETDVDDLKKINELSVE